MDNQSNELISALSRITNVCEYKNKPDKIINKNFEKTAILGGGKVNVKIDICSLPSKELLNALDKLQEFSNKLMFEEIPDSITKS